MEIIQPKQLRSISAYQSLKLFSLHNEIRLLMYASVLLFTTGAGILIYENIDSIGHLILILLLLLATIGCFLFAFKVAPKFSPSETDFRNPAYNYLVLAGTMLGGIFIHYLEFQYKPFGDDLAWPALITAVFSIFVGYRFDSRPALTIGLTALAASIGITATPQAVVQGDFLADGTLLWSVLLLAVAYAVVAQWSQNKGFKTHFAPVYRTFSQHLASVVGIIGLFGDNWPVYILIAGVVNWYFWKISHREKSTSLFVFALLYGFLSMNIAIGQIINALDLWDMFMLIGILLPFYLVGAIILYVRAIKQFNKKHA